MKGTTENGKKVTDVQGREKSAEAGSAGSKVGEQSQSRGAPKTSSSQNNPKEQLNKNPKGNLSQKDRSESEKNFQNKINQKDKY